MLLRHIREEKGDVVYKLWREQTRYWTLRTPPPATLFLLQYLLTLVSCLGRLVPVFRPALDRPDAIEVGYECDETRLSDPVRFPRSRASATLRFSLLPIPGGFYEFTRRRASLLLPQIGRTQTHRRHARVLLRHSRRYG